MWFESTGKRKNTVYKITLKIGDIVKLERGEYAGEIGIVSKPITIRRAGHVLGYGEGVILGLPTSMDDLKPADKSSKGYAQLATDLIELRLL
jgi:hypothetical protein